jgi:catechol 2,3-dioxygenase-like lactoylglutathione lyase family enzyme
VFDHITLTVSDVPRAVTFYRQALEPLGFRLEQEYDGGAGFGAPGSPQLWLMAGTPSKVHLGLRAPSQQAVAAFHQAALAAGGTDNGAPGLRESYGPSYYAAFTHDPDGNNVEAVTYGK